MSRRMGLYGAGGEVLYNLYNNGTVSEAIGGFTKTTSAGTLTMGSRYMVLGQSTSAILCLAQTNKPIKADKIKRLTASVVHSASADSQKGYLGYSTKPGVTTLAGLDKYTTFTASSVYAGMLSLDLSAVKGKIYIYVGYQSTAGGLASAQYNTFFDISTVIDKGVSASGDLYNAGVVHEKIGGFVRSGASDRAQNLTLNSTSMVVSSNSANRGTFARTKYPIKMDDLSSISITWTKNSTYDPTLAYFGYAVEGSVITHGNLDGKKSTVNAVTNWVLDVSSVTGYAYIYFGIQPTAGGYSTAPAITVKKITAATNTGN